jgi:hypothetical protein
MHDVIVDFDQSYFERVYRLARAPSREAEQGHRKHYDRECDVKTHVPPL